MNTEYNFDWIDEPIEKLPNKQGWYRLFCLMLFKRRMTYANMYVLTYGLHKNKFKDNEDVLKEKILKDLAALYFFNNNKLPDGFEFTVE
jgi:hypothetical protein